PHCMPTRDKMRAVINGREKELPAGATVAQAIEGEPYLPGSSVALIRPMDAQRKLTNEYMVKTPRGCFIIELNDSRYAEAWKTLYHNVVGRSLRWQTSKLHAFGSFPTQFEKGRGVSHYRRYDCFFALGGYDVSTTYVMIARTDMDEDLGLMDAAFGRVTRGRYVLDLLQEGDVIEDIEPVVLRLTSKDALTVTDLNVPVEDGMLIETYVGVKLDDRSPLCCEHFLVVTSEGSLSIDEKGFSYTASEANLDTSLGQEYSDVRRPGTVTVRHRGYQNGKIYFYNEVRQLNRSHNIVGTVTNGNDLMRLVPVKGSVLVQPDPIRIMTIGKTQAEAQAFLASLGKEQRRTGDTSDDAIVVEQEPELTIYAAKEKEIETMGVPKEKVYAVTLDPEGSPWTVRYFRKITGLDHKPIGTMKVHFTFEGMPMITFEGDSLLAADLYPERQFEQQSTRGDVAITNMSRPQRGLIGIRLEESEEFGPTGEEPHGANMLGRLIGDLDALMDGIQEGEIIYIRPATAEEAVGPRKRKGQKKKASAGKRAVNKSGEG
ncbi:MAG TPA: methanogenesis marker 3 protein, partial [Methanomassiliicoccales archaeon]|nr:methanogenesis marker 3 protein [Methanomassiliicoccales archaeon]